MEVFAEVMEKGVTPVTVLVGLLGNVLSICVLRKKEIQVSWYRVSSFPLGLSQYQTHAASLPLVRFSVPLLPPTDADVIFSWPL